MLGFLDGMACAVEGVRRHLGEQQSTERVEHDDQPPHDTPTPMQVWHPERVGFYRTPEQED
jgi:hypothetical protein